MLRLCLINYRYESVLGFSNLHKQSLKEKATWPDINCRAVTRRQRKTKGHGNSENASDALGELSSKDRFRVKSFIPMLDVLEANL